MHTVCGLDQLINSSDLQKRFSGNIGYLCNSASVDRNLIFGMVHLKKIFGSRLKKVFSPQHGLFADVQDNMLESPHFRSKYFELDVFSLYSETRSPEYEWLVDLDHLVIDLQDVGTRVYTYIYTVALSMIACKKALTKVTILDRPNPIGGMEIEGNILDPNFSSFVGMYPIPMRHGLTIGEFALLANNHFGIECELEVIQLQNWRRDMYFDETGLPWVQPSPNLPGLRSTMVYPGMVILEGTNLSEGRGTVKPFEIFGQPGIEPFSLLNKLTSVFKENGLDGFVLRPLLFQPTFHKFQDQVCGGYQLHITDQNKFKPWQAALLITKVLRQNLEEEFSWNQPPFEYEYEKLPFDILNGTDKIRRWIEEDDSVDELLKLESEGLNKYLDIRDSVLLYP